MNSLAISSIVLTSSFGAGVVGMVLHGRLPPHHLNRDSQEVVKLVMGLLATVSALVLSLLIASASTEYDRQSTDLKVLSANIMILDRTLKSYGPEAKPVRDGLRDVVKSTHDRIWSPDGIRPESMDSEATRKATRANIAMLHGLVPQTAAERLFQARAIDQADALSLARVLMFESLSNSIPWPFLTVLILWISLLFLGFGLFTSPNSTVTLALFAGAVSVACAIFLILELNDPYHGLMRLSDKPLRDAIVHIER